VYFRGETAYVEEQVRFAGSAATFVLFVVSDSRIGKGSTGFGMNGYVPLLMLVGKLGFVVHGLFSLENFPVSAS
jgi:hypothetical protein